MKAMSLAGAVAIALTFSTAAALAQSGPHVGDGKNSLDPYTGQAPYAYDVGSGAAHVGNGANSKLVPNQYSAAGGAAGADAREHYVAGKTQSLAPPPGMAKTEGDGR